MLDWPQPYVPGDPNGDLKKPTLSRSQCISLGIALVNMLLQPRTTAVDFAQDYLSSVKLYYRTSGDLFSSYLILIKEANDAMDPSARVDLTTFNMHDFANVHRAAWLVVVRAVSRLVALNPFNDPANNPNPWADPPGGSAGRFVDMPTKHGHFFFGIPNATGYYAVTHDDIDVFDKSALKIPPPPVETPLA